MRPTESDITLSGKNTVVKFSAGGKTITSHSKTDSFDGTKIPRETWGNNTLIPLYDNEDSVCGIIAKGFKVIYH